MLTFGIIGSSKISHDFLTASRQQFKAVASNSIERAKEFADKHKIALSFGSYEQLAKCPEVKVVYVGCLNPDHFDAVQLCLHSGKPVLCEKPLTLTPEHTKHLIDLAKRKNVFLMEGFWSRFFPAYQRLSEIVDQRLLGDIRLVNASFTVNLEDVQRLTEARFGGGALYDIGVYCIQFALFVYKEYPTEIKCTGDVFEQSYKIAKETNDSKQLVDKSANIHLKFSGNRTANLLCNATCEGPSTASVCGSAGYAQLPGRFWCPTELELNGTVEQFPLPDHAPSTEYNFVNSAGLKYEADHVVDCLGKAYKESPIVPHEHSIWLAEIVADCRSQIARSFGF